MLTLDGRFLCAPVDSIIGPKTVITIQNEGMPIFTSRKADDNEIQRGDLYIRFEISFPKTLKED